MSLTIHQWLTRRTTSLQVIRFSGLAYPQNWTWNDNIGTHRTRCGCRALSTVPTVKKPRDKDNYNTSPFDDNGSEEHKEYKVVTANDLESSTEPPRKVRMLARDFIEDSLYNPHYGYFSRQATIFSTPPTTFQFSKFRDSVEFQNEVAKLYSGYGVNQTGPGKQIWHTPTELFKVYFDTS